MGQQTLGLRDARHSARFRSSVRALEWRSASERVSKFAEHESRQSEAIAKVAARQASWLECHAVHPLQSRSTHPLRSALLFASQKIDRCAHAERDLRSNLIAMPVDPEFLFGRPQPDNQHVRCDGRDLVQYPPVLRLVVLESQRWAVASYHANSLPSIFYGPRCPLIHLGPCSQQIDADRAIDPPAIKQLRDEVAPRNALRNGTSKHSGQENDWRAVRE